MHYYVGILSNQGKIVLEDEAFGVAMASVLNDEKAYEEFELEFGRRLLLGTISCRTSFKAFAKDVVDWFFSGNWIERLE